MRILVLGAAGFIGSRLTASLLARGALQPQGGKKRVIRELVLADARPVTAAHPSSASIKIHALQGDIGSCHFLDQVFSTQFDAVYHLAATLTLDAERDFAHGMEVNVHALMHLLEYCRKQDSAPAFLFASSLSAFGGALPDTVDDDVAQTPQTSYGTHKAIAELLINDYSRRGFLDGRVLRLPVVLTHPGSASASVTDRIAALIREPLHGKDVVCPLDPATRLPVASVQNVVSAFIRAHELPPSSFGATRVMNLPALTVTPADIAAALQQNAVPQVLGRIHWQRDDKVQRIVDSWPRGFTSAAAMKHGITADASIAAIIQDYLDTDLARA